MHTAVAGMRQDQPQLYVNFSISMARKLKETDSYEQVSGCGSRFVIEMPFHA